MGEEGVTFFQPSGTAKVNGPTLTGSAGCSAGAVATASRKKAAAKNTVLMNEDKSEMQEKEMGLVFAAVAIRHQETLR